MAGIFGYIGTEDCREALFSNADLLYRRGCDSVAIAIGGEEVTCFRDKGIARLQDNSVKTALFECSRDTISMADNNMFAVAVDGCVMNYDELKIKTGNPFLVENNEDLLLAMLCVSNRKDKLELVKIVSSVIVGEPTFCFLAGGDNAIYCKKGREPLFIGVAKNGHYISSEINALVGLADKYIMLEDGDVARVLEDKIIVLDSRNRRVKRTAMPTPSEHTSITDYPIADEVYYCSLAVKQAYKSAVKNDKVEFDKFRLSRHSAERIEQIILFGAGSSYYLAKASEYNLLTFTDINCVALSSAELLTTSRIIDKNTLAVAISHSGENMDTVNALKHCKSMGAKVLAVCSNDYSYLSQLADFVINPSCDYCEDDISLRSFLAGYTSLAMLSIYLGSRLGIVSELYHSVAVKMADGLAGKVSSSIKNTTQLQHCADALKEADRVLITGYMCDSAIADECADKLRKLTGDKAFSSSIELADSLVDSNTVVLAIISDGAYLSCVMPRLKAFKDKGASVIIITDTNVEEDITEFDSVLAVNDTIPLLNPAPIVAVLYKIAVLMMEASPKLIAI